MRTTILGLTAVLCMAWVAAAGEGQLAEAFRNPPDSTKPWCYWYWLNGEVTREGVTKDLEHMAEIGICKAMIGNIHIGRLKDRKPKFKVMSPEWRALTRHAMKEAKRVGVEIYMFNGPGWSQSGGPWNKPEQSMRRVTWQEYPSSKGTVSLQVRPKNIPASQDIAVLAVPQRAAVSIEGKSSDAQRKKSVSLLFQHSAPFTARALIVEAPSVAGTLFAMQDGNWAKVADIQGRKGNPKTDFLPNAPHLFSFQDVTASRFKLSCPHGIKGKATLTSEPKVPQHSDKQMGRMHPTPSPTWDSYLFCAGVEPADASVLNRKEQVLNLTEKLNAKGQLNCTLPEGNWTVIYFGMIPTGKTNHPAAPEVTGLECDKMSKAAIEHHFQAAFGTLLKEMTPEEKSAFTGVTIDSYEVGSQNWTDGFATEFERRSGYSPLPFLPVLTGRMVESARASDQFLWDLRRTVADMIAENYVGGLRDIAHKHHMVLWLENYGHWGFPGEFLSYGRFTDELGGEFWTTNAQLGPIECRAASSAGHIYGKQRIYAEAFTSGLKLGHRPLDLKARGEELFTEGVNHFVLHVYANQTSEGAPGKNPWFGTAFHRNNPWARDCRDWVRYLQRCHYMLQQGEPVADVAVYIGDFAPQMTGPAHPVPAGYDYDYIGSDAILHSLNVVNGEWVVYDEKNPKRIAARYPRLAMPKLDYIRPNVRERLDALKNAGGKVLEAIPVTPSALQKEGLAPVLTDASCPIRWKARRLSDGMLFFITNFKKAGPFSVRLRVTGLAPVLYNPATGGIERPAHYQLERNSTRVFLNVKDVRESYFVVFQDKPSRPSVVKHSAPAALHLYFNDEGTLMAESATAGNYTLTLSDGSTKTLAFAKAPAPVAIKGPWKTRPRPNHPEGYSIVRETTFKLPPGFGDNASVALDLGQVVDMAQVTINGHACETLWVPPFVLDVTEHLKPDENKLKVIVTSALGKKPQMGAVHLRATPRVPVK